MEKMSEYLHVCNSGVTFSITDEYGPTITIETNAFGNLDNQTKIFTTKESLKKLGELFTKAANEEYLTKEYCSSAKCRDEIQRNWDSWKTEEICGDSSNDKECIDITNDEEDFLKIKKENKNA